MVWPRTVGKCLLLPSQCTAVHSLHIFEMALMSVEDPDVFDCAKRGCVLWSPCLLLPSQCTAVHSLRIFKMALIFIEEPEVIDCVECGCLLGSQCHLITG